MNGLLKLQNGTDIRGVALENDQREVTMKDSDIRAIAKGILRWLSKKNTTKTSNLRIAIGMDSRLSGPKIKSLLIEEFSKQGVQILDCNLATTPSMFMTTIWEDYLCHLGIMITASHLPFFLQRTQVVHSTRRRTKRRYCRNPKLGSGAIRYADGRDCGGSCSQCGHSFGLFQYAGEVHHRRDGNEQAF